MSNHSIYNDTVNAVFGGLLIGLVASVRFSIFGKITGISGYFSRLVKPTFNIFTEQKFIEFLFVGSFLVSIIYIYYMHDIYL